MNKKLQYRLLLIVAVTVVAVVLLYWNNINLGLDLQGGIHMVLQVETNDALVEEIDQTRERIQNELTEQSAVFAEVRVVEGRVEISGVAAESTGPVENVLATYTPAWSFTSRTAETRTNYTLQMSTAYRRQLATQSVRQAREIVARRVDQYGVAEPTITIYGSGEVQDQIIVELPGVEDFDRVKDLIKSTARLELKLTHPDPSKRGPFPTRDAANIAFQGLPADQFQILAYQDRGQGTAQSGFMIVSRAATITGQHLKNARRAQDPYSGRAEVSFFLNAEGVTRFSQATGDNVGNQLAIVLDDVIRSAPNINERIDSDSARITGSFTAEEADDLALVLRSGALPARLRILEERSVGPSLGRDSIVRGIWASGVATLLVVVVMLVVYRLSAVNALLCLVLNMLVLMGVLAYFQATLTLPGIAGLILTIGMAVDANILIFERIKEELRVGKAIRTAVDAGFGRVFGTICDTNITTLIASLFLFQFGTGPLRGFAITLAVGLLANLFTATFVSRTVFTLLVQGREGNRLSI